MSRVSANRNLSGWRQTVTAIFVVALLIRGAFVLSLQDGFYFPDSLDYSTAAVNLLTHGAFGETYRRAPVYPLFLAGIYALFGQQIVAVRLVEALLGAGLAVVIAAIARRIGGEVVGAVAGALWSVYPLGIFIAGLVYPTSVAAILLTCALLCMVTEADQELASERVVVGGLLFGLATLTVPVALVTVAAITLWVTYWQRTRRLLLVTLFICGAAIPLAPWTVRNFYIYDQLVFVEPRLIDQLPLLNGIQKDGNSYKSDDKINAILENPAAFARRYIREFGHFWELYPDRIQMNQSTIRERMHAEDPRIVGATVFGSSWTSFISIISVGPVFLLALVGTGALCSQKERRPAVSLLYVSILSFAVCYPVFSGKMRYRIPIEPYIIILSAYGLRQISVVLARRPARDLARSPEKYEWSEAQHKLTNQSESVRASSVPMKGCSDQGG